MNCSATIAAVIVDKRCAKPPTAMPTTKLTTRKHVHSARLVGMASNENKMSCRERERARLRVKRQQS